GGAAEVRAGAFGVGGGVQADDGGADGGGHVGGAGVGGDEGGGAFEQGHHLREGVAADGVDEGLPGGGFDGRGHVLFDGAAAAGQYHAHSVQAGGVVGDPGVVLGAPVAARVAGAGADDQHAAVFF